MLSILGFASPFSEDCTVEALTQASNDMAGENVLTDDLSYRWRGLPGFSALRISFASNRYGLIDSVYLADHNLNGVTAFGSGTYGLQSDHWRVAISDDPSLDIYQIPFSVQSLTGLSGSGFTAYHPANSLSPAYSSTPGAASLGRWRFKNPLPLFLPGALGAGFQNFQVFYTTTGTGTVSLTARLKENGTLLSTLASGSPLTVPLSDYGTLSYTWSGSLLTLSVPELELETTATGTAAIHWHGIRWTVAMPNGDHFYDSGELTPPITPTYRDADRTSLSDAHILPSPRIAARMFIMLERFGYNTSTVGQAAEAGRIDGGLRLQFRMAADSWVITLEDPSLFIPMRAGTERIHFREPFLRAEVNTPPILIQTALDTKLGLELQGGLRKGYYWMFDDEDRSKAPYTWFFGRMSGLIGLSNLARFFKSGFNVRQIR